MYLVGRTKCPFCSCVVVGETPQRTQRSRVRSTPADAAERGSKALDTSTHAQTFAAWVRRPTNERANDVHPEHSGPTTSVMPPIGRPPCSTSSTAAMPVAATGRIILGTGVSPAPLLLSNHLYTRLGPDLLACGSPYFDRRRKPCAANTVTRAPRGRRLSESVTELVIRHPDVMEVRGNSTQL
jgi:hypothetical protein